jgi:hypothetical protein
MAPLKRSGVTGDKELAAALRELAKGPTVREIDQAAAVAMAPMLEKTKSRFQALRNYIGKWPGFPQPSANPPGGHVDEGIVFRKSGKQGAKKRYFRLGATRRARFLLHLLEYGVASHWQPRFRGGWLHPGAKAHPSLTPSYDEEKSKVPETFGRIIGQNMAAKISRLKKGPRRRR